MRDRRILLITFFLFAVFSVSAQEWVSLDSGVTNQLNAITCPTQLTCYAVGGAPFIGGPGIIIKTTNGTAWTVQPIPTTNFLRAIDCVDSRTCYATGDEVIVKTVDGTTWTIANQSNGIFWDIDALSDSTVIAVGNLGATLRTTNGGLTWPGYLPTAFDSSRASFSTIFFINSTMGWRGGDARVIQKTNDAGLSWSDFDSGQSLSISDVFSLDGQLLWATAGFSYILKSTDGGESWEQHEVLPAGGFPAITFINETYGWIMGNGVMEHSRDGGLTWEDVDLDLSYTFFRDIDCPSEQVCYVVGNDGTLVRWGEPFIARVILPNETRVVRVPARNDSDSEPTCLPFFDDCEAGFDPSWEYNESGCAIDYTCVEAGAGMNINLSQLNEQFSTFLQHVPGLSPNEIISVYVSREKGTPLTLSFRLDQGQVVDIALSDQEDWTLRAQTDEQTLNRILAAQDPATEALSAINNNEIKLQGKTVGKKIKLGFLKVGLKIAGIFN